MARKKDPEITEYKLKTGKSIFDLGLTSVLILKLVKL